VSEELVCRRRRVGRLDPPLLVLAGGRGRREGARPRPRVEDAAAAVGDAGGGESDDIWLQRVLPNRAPA
jgi:hypothetical protein